LGPPNSCISSPGEQRVWGEERAVFALTRSWELCDSVTLDKFLNLPELQLPHL